MDGEENARCQQLARAGGLGVAGRAGASGAVLHARRQADGLGPAEETLRLSAGRAAGGPGKGSGGPGAAAGRSRLAREGAAGRLPRPAQPWPTRLVVPAATSRCHVREASTGVLPLPAPRGPLAAPPPPPGAAGHHQSRARTSRRQRGRARAPEPDVSGARPRHAPALTPPANPASPLTSV